MSDPFLFIGMDVIELAGALHPLTLGYTAVTKSRVIEAVKLLDWTRCYPTPGDPAYRNPPRGGARLSEADWKQALAGATALEWLDLPLIRQGHSPRSALAWIHRHITMVTAFGGYLVLHSHWPDIPALYGAVQRWLGRPLPEVRVSFTGQLEMAARLGLRPQPGEDFDDFNRRLEAQSEAPASLEECLRRHGLDPGLPQNDPLHRTRGIRLLYEELLPHFEGGRGR